MFLLPWKGCSSCSVTLLSASSLSENTAPHPCLYLCQLNNAHPPYHHTLSNNQLTLINQRCQHDVNASKWNCHNLCTLLIDYEVKCDIFFLKPLSHPSPDGEEGAEDGSSDWPLTIPWLRVIRLCPLVHEREEWEETGHSPEHWTPVIRYHDHQLSSTWEWEICENKVFPGLDTGHLIKEEFSNKKSWK